MNATLEIIGKKHGQGSFAPVNIVDLHNKKKTLSPATYPVLGEYDFDEETVLPESPAFISAIYGKELENGNLRLILIHSSNRYTLLTETPPYTVFWATNNATAQATGGNNEG
jgi:hypothetical protein